MTSPKFKIDGASSPSRLHAHIDGYEDVPLTDTASGMPSIVPASSSPALISSKFTVHSAQLANYANAEEGSSRRELADYKKMYDKLHKQFQKMTVRCQQYQDETRDLRASSEAQLKQIAYGERKFEHIRAERDSLRDKVDEKSKTLAKIERKLTGGSGGQYLADRYKELRRYTKSLKVKLSKQQSVISSQEENLYNASEEIEILARALEVRSDSLKLQNGGSVEDSILYEVAALRQKIQHMDDDIVSKRNIVHTLNKEKESLLSQLSKAEQSKEAVEKQTLSMRIECNQASAAAADSATRVRDLESERTVMLDFINEMKEQIADAKTQKEADDKKFFAEINALRSKAKQLEDQDGGLKGNLSEAEQRIEHMLHVQNLTEQRLADEHLNNMSLKEDSVSQAKRISEQEGTIASLHKKVGELEAERFKLDRTNEILRKQLDENNLLMEDMAAQTEKTRTSFETLKKEKHDKEQAFRREIEGVMGELQKAVLEKERSESSMRSAVDTCVSMTQERDNAFVKLKTLEDECYLIKENKGLLQKTMLEQINQLRSDEQRLTMERDTAVIELANLTEEKSNLSILMDATRAKMHKGVTPPRREMERMATRASTVEHMEHVRQALQKYGMDSRKIIGNSGQKQTFSSKTSSFKESRVQVHHRPSGSIEVNYGDESVGESPTLIDLASTDDDMSGRAY